MNHQHFCRHCCQAVPLDCSSWHERNYDPDGMICTLSDYDVVCEDCHAADVEEDTELAEAEA